MRNTKLIALVLFFLAWWLSGCGKIQRAWTNFTGDLTYKCAQTGVVYVQSDSGIALLVDADGRPVPCDK